MDCFVIWLHWHLCFCFLIWQDKCDADSGCLPTYNERKYCRLQSDSQGQSQGQSQGHLYVIHELWLLIRLNTHFLNHVRVFLLFNLISISICSQWPSCLVWNVQQYLFWEARFILLWTCGSIEYRPWTMCEPEPRFTVCKNGACFMIVLLEVIGRILKQDREVEEER